MNPSELVVSAGVSALNQGKDMTTITIQLIVVSTYLFLYLAILIAIDWCVLATIVLVDLVDRLMQPCESPSLCLLRFTFRSLSRTKFQLFITIFVAVEHAIVHRNSRCVGTCSFARFIAIEVPVRDYHRDRQMSSCNPLRTRLARSRASSRAAYSFAKARRDRVEILVCDHGRDRTSSPSPTRCSSRLDGATACHVLL